MKISHCQILIVLIRKHSIFASANLAEAATTTWVLSVSLFFSAFRNH